MTVSVVKTELEQKLDRLGYTYIKHEAYPLSKLQAMRGMQLREGPTLKSTVEDYTVDLENFGTAGWPPVLIGKVGNRLVRIDGAHRIQAAGEARLTSFPAIEITNFKDELEAELLAIELNRHGERYTREDRVAQADRLIKRFGLSELEAARRVGLKVRHLRQHKAACEARERVKEQLGLPELAAQLESDLLAAELNRLSDEHLPSVLPVVVRPDLNVETKRTIVRKSRSAKSAEQARQIVDQALKQLPAISVVPPRLASTAGKRRVLVRRPEVVVMQRQQAYWSALDEHYNAMVEHYRVHLEEAAVYVRTWRERIELELQLMEAIDPDDALLSLSRAL